MRTVCGTILAAVVGLSLAAEVPKTVDGKVELVKAEDVNTPKYDGTWFQPCQIMVVGRILK